MSTAIWIDTYSRRLTAYAVSVTKINSGGLVLRFGAEIGPFEEIARNSGRIEFPILLGMSGYGAQSSAGFVEVLTCWRGGHPRAKIVGVQGFPWMKKGALVPLKNPQEVIMLPAGSMIKTLKVQGSARMGNFPSNHAATEAARKGLELRLEVFPQQVILAEGQSDYCKGWALCPPEEGKVMEEWPAEHQRAVFESPRTETPEVSGPATEVVRSFEGGEDE